MPWVDAYEPHEWTVHTITLQEAEALTKKLRPIRDGEVVVCGAESPAAADHWRREGNVDRVFYYDFEQMAMGLDKTYGVADFGVLLEPWNGHQAGALVLSVYSGVTKTPPSMTAAVADASPLI